MKEVELWRAEVEPWKNTVHGDLYGRNGSEKGIIREFRDLCAEKRGRRSLADWILTASSIVSGVLVALDKLHFLLGGKH